MKSYSSIDDMPMYNWNEVHKTGDLSFMLIDKSKTKGINYEKLAHLWRDIYEQYIAKFGFDNKYLKILEKQLYIAELRIEKAVTGNQTINTFIEIEKQLLAKLMETTTKGADFYESKALLEKKLGFAIDIRKCTVIEFYSYIKAVEKYGK